MKFCPFLLDEDLSTAIYSFVTTTLHYWYSLHLGLKLDAMQRLQLVQREVICILNGTSHDMSSICSNASIGSQPTSITSLRPGSSSSKLSMDQEQAKSMTMVPTMTQQGHKILGGGFNQITPNFSAQSQNKEFNIFLTTKNQPAQQNVAF